MNSFLKTPIRTFAQVVLCILLCVNTSLGADDEPSEFARLSQLIQAGDLRGLREARYQGSDINVRGKFGRSLVFMAVLNEQPEILEWLLKRKVNPHAAPIFSPTPAALAFERSHREMVNLILAQPDAVALELSEALFYHKTSEAWLTYLLDRSEYQEGPLSEPLLKALFLSLLSDAPRRVQVREFFFERPFPAAQSSRVGETAMHVLALIDSEDQAPEKTLELAQKLQSLGGEVNAKTTQGDRPLHYAAQFGSIKLIRWLCAQGASPEEPNVDGLTPLAGAVWAERPLHVEALLDCGSQAEEPQRLLAFTGRAQEIKKGAKLNQKDLQWAGYSPFGYQLIWAAARSEKVENLAFAAQELGQSLDQQSPSGKLLYQTWLDKPESALFILELGVDLGKISKDAKKRIEKWALSGEQDNLLQYLKQVGKTKLDQFGLDGAAIEAQYSSRFIKPAQFLTRWLGVIVSGVFWGLLLLVGAHKLKMYLKRSKKQPPGDKT